jgi:hypothetical protein
LACLDYRRHSERSLPPNSPVSGGHISLNGLFKANDVTTDSGTTVIMMQKTLKKTKRMSTAQAPRNTRSN